MRNKNLLKVKKVGEERYFKNDGEFLAFIEKQEGVTLDEMYQRNIRLQSQNNFHYALLRNNFAYCDKKFDKYLIGDFIFRVVRGTFQRNSGTYTINIIAEQSRNKLSLNDLKKLFNIQ